MSGTRKEKLSEQKVVPTHGQVAVGHNLRPFEREFIRRVAHQGEPVEKAIKKLDRGPGGPMTLPQILRPPVLEALLNEFAVMQAHLAASDAQWVKLVRDAKNCLSEIINDGKTSPAAKVSACKVIFDGVKTADPMLLKEKDLTQDLEDAVESIITQGPQSKTVN